MYILKNYVIGNKVMSFVALYFLVSILLKIIFSVNILIPCLWKTFFHVECPGCGLTRAFIYILHGNFVDAFNQNALIFIILPAGLIYLFIDILKFKKKLKTA